VRLPLLPLTGDREERSGAAAGRYQELSVYSVANRDRSWSYTGGSNERSNSIEFSDRSWPDLRRQFDFPRGVIEPRPRPLHALTKRLSEILTHATRRLLQKRGYEGASMRDLSRGERHVAGRALLLLRVPKSGCSFLIQKHTFTNHRAAAERSVGKA